MRISYNPDIEFTQEDIDKALTPPNSFGYMGDNDEMFKTWTLGPIIEHRDSGILDRSNAVALKAFLKGDKSLAEDYDILSANHWAVGHCDHLTYRVVDSEGKPTRIAKILKAWFEYLRDQYPIADEDLYSQMEWDTTMDWVEQETPRVARQYGYKLPADGIDKVWTWLSQENPNCLESVDDQGGSPNNEDYIEAFDALGFEKESEDE